MSMTTLYSLRTDGDQYRITKFVDGEPEGSYLTSERECECPAGHRATCRHRQMLPQMLAHGIANTHWFMDWDRSGSIVDFNGASKRLYDELAAIPGIQFLDLNDPAGIHNAIAEAVGEAQHVEEDTASYGTGPIMHELPLIQVENKRVSVELKTPLPPIAWRRL
jgi:hypothetical protein